MEVHGANADPDAIAPEQVSPAQTRPMSRRTGNRDDREKMEERKKGKLTPSPTNAVRLQRHDKLHPRQVADDRLEMKEMTDGVIRRRREYLLT